MVYYDLHLHSCLSPCGDELMTPNNMINMAKICGLDLISVTDHNTMRQQKACCRCARRQGIDYLCGVEMESREEVHLLAYFPPAMIDPVQQWLQSHYSGQPNSIAYFGHQRVMNEWDEIVDEEPQRLLDCLNASLKECVEAVHHFHGKAVLAHVLNRRNGVIEQLGFIPPDLAVDGIEVSHPSQLEQVRNNSPWAADLPWLCSSDAHQLTDIQERVAAISEDQAAWLKGERT